MPTIREVEALKREVEEAKQAKAHAQGRIQQLLESLGVSSLEEAQTRLTQLEKDLKKAEERARDQQEKWKETYGTKLGLE